ncbi:MAG: AAA family ATPase [bacterium]|nr:AAA family ATPase [bacterium]
MDTKNATWGTVGNGHVKQMLDSHLASGNLSHAYLFSGPKGVGKRSLAREFAQKIVHPVSSQQVVVTHDIAQQGSVDDIRGMLKLAALTPAQGKHSVVVLDGMHAASIAASNALLKTLEEPSGHTIFLLISDTSKVLPTIMSRCQIMQCHRLTTSDLRAHAEARQWDVTGEMLHAAAGSINRLHALAERTERGLMIQTELQRVRESLGQGDAEKMLLVQHLADLDDDVLIEVLEGWTFEQTASLKTKPQRYMAVQAVLETIQRLRRNVNKKMALTYFVTVTNL